MSVGAGGALPAAGLATPVLRGRVIEQAAAERDLRDAMFALLASHFAGVERQTFERDLAGKTDVILLEDEEDRLRGFSTLLVYPAVVADRALTVVYSGDTIVERAWWGSPVLARTWIHAVRRRAGRAGRDVYWLLLTSGFRTYRFLPVFYRSFHPSVDEPTPPATQALLDALARDRFGPRYDPTAGVVRFDRPQVLVPDLLDVPDGRARDRHVAFFLDRNPGFVAGDELVCLTRVADDNLTAAGRRMVRGGGNGVTPCV